MASCAAIETRSTCPYCGVGCGVIITSVDAQVTGVRGDPDHPANAGRLCTKGSTLHLTAAPHVTQQMRAMLPMRRVARGQSLEPIGWQTALDEVAQRFANTVQTRGPDAVGLYLSGQLLTEDYYVFNKLAKGLLGTNNIDTNSRLCMSSAVAGYKASLGADAPPACYEDIQLAQTVFITGANMAWAHPVLYRRLEDARRANPGQKWIVADPRRTETGAEADLHLQLLPGTDVVLHHALLHVMLWEGLTDPGFIAAHTTGFGDLRDRVREFTPLHAARVCGLCADDIVQAARWFAGLQADGTRQPSLSLWCQGLNQSSSGTDKNTTLINLHLATGQIGKPGAGPLSLTGQPNAMGGREVGGMANLLSAHRDQSNAQHRAEVAALWGLPSVPASPGKSAVQMFEAAADGQIRALWIACTNPAHSMPDQATVRRALQRAEFVVLQDAYAHTATAAYADLLLPATSWGEKDGTVTNSERCITRVRAAVPPPGQARHDWAIVVDVAQRIEALLPPARVPGLEGRTLFPYISPESIWNEHRETTRGRDLDITGMSYGLLEQQAQQWPRAQHATASTSRLYTDGRFATADGRARFTAPAWRGPAQPRDARYPVSLTTGRLRDQWHGMSRTGTLGRLFAHDGDPGVQMHPQELARRHWRSGDLVRVSSRQGTLVLPVRSSEDVAPSQAFIAMHWGPEYLGGRGGMGVNALTGNASCPSSHQPELKHTAVRVEPADLPWRMAATAWLPADQALDLRKRLMDLAERLDYASCVPFGREPGARLGLRFQAAATQPANAGLLVEIEAALGLAATPVLRYADTRNGQHRTLALAPDGALQAYLLAGDTTGDAWLLGLLQQGEPAARFGQALLAAGGTPPQQLPSRSRQVCACHDVSEARIVAKLQASAGNSADRLACLQQSLHCGTVCGSCLPSLRALVQQTPHAPLAQALRAQAPPALVNLP